MILFIASALALALHVLLGWQWSIIGGVAAGLGTKRFGWAAGMISVSIAWLVLVAYNFSVAPAEMARFVAITSRLFGNLPGPLLVVMTISLGGLLGLLGGIIGGLIRSLVLSLRGRAPSRSMDLGTAREEPDSNSTN
ncbi:hypothetical protein ACFLRO_01365 [Bacteroidota bacterium]